MRIKTKLRRTSYREMAGIIGQIQGELERRNPIFVNAYIPYLKQAVSALGELSRCEANRHTGDCGPHENPIREHAEYNRMLEQGFN